MNARPVGTGRASASSCLGEAGCPRFAGIFEERPVGLEVAVALDAEAKGTADAFQLGEADATDLRVAHAQVAEAEGDVFVLRIDLGQDPGPCPGRIEELHDGSEIDLLRHPAQGYLDAAVGDELGAEVFGQQFHGLSPCVECFTPKVA